MQLSDIDLLDRDRFTQGVPHEWFTYLRNEAPVYYHPEPDGPGLLGDHQVRRRRHRRPRRRDVLVRPEARRRRRLEGRPEDYQFEQGGNLMLTMDAPEHTRYRKLVNRGFTPRQMRMLEPHIRELTNQILDDVIEAGRVRLRRRRRGRAAAAGDRRDDRRARRRTGTSSSSGATG